MKKSRLNELGQEIPNPKPVGVSLRIQRRGVDPQAGLMARVQNMIRASREEDAPAETMFDSKDLDVPADEYRETRVTEHTTEFVKDVGHVLTQSEKRFFDREREAGYAEGDRAYKKHYVTAKKKKKKVVDQDAEG